MSAIKATYPLGFPWKTQDPFLFCVHHLDNYPAGNEYLGPKTSLAGRNLGQDFAPNASGWRMYHGRRVPGFPAHPHYGFETVTIVTNGVVDHSDSLGAAGRFGYGDVQWMTAGKGVQHCEMFPLLNEGQNNPLELFQIWLNLPMKSKGASPYFSMFWSETIPVHKHVDRNGRLTTVKVIAGTLGDITPPAAPPESWAADSLNEVAIWTIRMDPAAEWTIPSTAKDVNRSLFFYGGASVVISGKVVSAPQAIELDARPITLVNGNTESSFLLLQGKPIHEPVVQHGPFVATSANEIQDVMREFERTNFGGWPWPSFDHVHPRNRTRFARYPDGREEVRSFQ